MPAPSWPAAPWRAVDVGDRWYVYAVPPLNPWPELGYRYRDDPAYGPAGTTWIFTVADLVDAIDHLPGSAFLLAQIARAWLAKFCINKPDATSLAWVVPGGIDGPGDGGFYAMRWFRATIHGKLGSMEEVAHTFALRTQPAPDVDQTVAQVKTLAGQLRDAWASFFTTNFAGLGSAPASLFSSALTYDEVRCAYLEQTVAGTDPVPHQPDPKRPRYLVDTQYATFAPGVNGTCATPELPWEVACCLTLNTNVRGRSYRGRSYLGPFGASFMQPRNGYFVLAQASGLAAAFGTNFIDHINQTSAAQFQIVSRTHLLASPVQGVRVGIVPDSQRRRRRSQPESYQQAWGTAVGGAG